MINIAVVGVGRMGDVHANNVFKGRVKGARLVAVCDTDIKVLEHCESKYKNINSTIDYHQLVNKNYNIDAVIIATPHYFHTEIAEYFLLNDIHVLIEKPVAATVEQATKLNDIIDRNDAILCQIMYNQRTNNLYRKAKQLIGNGCIGDIQRVNYIITDWYRSQAYYDQGGWRASYKGEGGGTLINQCVHQLDILQWLVGMPNKVTAKCQTKVRNITTENDVYALFEYDNFDAVFTASTHELRGTNRLEIAGDKGKIIINTKSMKVIKCRHYEREVNANTSKGYGIVKSTSKRYHNGILQKLRDDTYGQQLNIINNFVQSIVAKDNDLMISPAKEGIRALSLINAMYLSSWRQESVSLPLNNQEYTSALLEQVQLEEKK